MSLLVDTTFVAIINIINTTLNVALTYRLRSVQVSKEIVADLREANEDKDKLIRHLEEKKNEYKNNYYHQVAVNKELTGKLSVYENEK